MSSKVNPNSIPTIIQILKESQTDYTKVKDEKDLGDTFHESGSALRTIYRALRTADKALPNADKLSEKSKESLKACGDKARLSKSLFQAVAQEPATSRLESYRTAVGRISKGDGVETLVIGMIRHVCDLAEDGILKRPMQEDVKVLQETRSKLLGMNPSVPKPQSTNIFRSEGESHQFNTVGGGPQNNNTGGGNQFTGSFHSPVYFGQGSS
ncbi:hypothetical protein EKO27_g5016 [Xylaria grammica]|uniref:NACHT-NTPase and P-loop NTPases N-terminal domain-containing protein n=1 Tax=Xylaria grammica TaxID=363999 RepID=A0A439D6Q2_9PEZI|nr:hypothetical protein EKO27_g5016 [Xylaria grammica]